MMKILGLIALAFWSYSMFSMDGKSRKSVEVIVVSDDFDNSIPDGKCKITGEVYFLGELHEGAEVCSYKGKECVVTDKKGRFTLLVDTSEINIYAAIIGAKTSYLQNYEFESQHHITLEFHIQQKYSAVRKPVVYLYSEEDVMVQLQLQTEVELSFTYPKYDDGWEVKIDPIEGLSVDGQYYPYLFWEGLDFGHLSYSMCGESLIGEVVRTDTLIGYFEKQLSAYGLNSTESTDFITFWGPILTKHDYAFIQFVVDDAYDEIAIIESSEEINNERRVFLMYESYDTEPSLKATNTQPKTTPLSRDGITLIEWGGAEVSLPKL